MNLNTLLDLNPLEVAILQYLKPKLGRSLTPESVYTGLYSHAPIGRDEFLMTLNILIKEGYVEGYVSSAWDNHTVTGIDQDGLKWLRATYGAYSPVNADKTKHS